MRVKAGGGGWQTKPHLCRVGNRLSAGKRDRCSHNAFHIDDLTTHVSLSLAHPIHRTCLAINIKLAALHRERFPQVSSDDGGFACHIRVES